MENVKNALMSLNSKEKSEMQVVTRGEISTKQAFNMLNGQDERITNGTEIDAVACLFHPYTLTDNETGEVTEHVRTVIRGANGTIYGSVSNGVFNQMKNLINMFGDLSEDEPIKIKFVETSFTGKDGKTRRSYKMKVVG